jgi:hypothetical protein
MDSARKYLALALAACQSKQYEEAGIFLVQASQSEGSEELAAELGAGSLPEVEEVSQEIVEETPTEVSTSSDDEEEVDLEWGDSEEGEEAVSESSARRKETTQVRIGKIMAAAMSVSSDEEDEYDEVDPDFEGETLIPASFSSVKVKQ